MNCVSCCFQVYAIEEDALFGSSPTAIGLLLLAASRYAKYGQCTEHKSTSSDEEHSNLATCCLRHNSHNVVALDQASLLLLAVRTHGEYVAILVLYILLYADVVAARRTLSEDVTLVVPRVLHNEETVATRIEVGYEQRIHSGLLATLLVELNGTDILNLGIAIEAC